MYADELKIGLHRGLISACGTKFKGAIEILPDTRIFIYSNEKTFMGSTNPNYYKYKDEFKYSFFWGYQSKFIDTSITIININFNEIGEL